MRKLPAGRYFFGDPCYVINDDDWDAFLGEFWELKKPGGVFEFNRLTCAAFYTAWGDGTYETSEGDVGVDAGMIGMVPVELIAESTLEIADGHIVDLVVDSECFEYDGTLNFGPTWADTDPGPECFDGHGCEYCGR